MSSGHWFHIQCWRHLMLLEDFCGLTVLSVCETRLSKELYKIKKWEIWGASLALPDNLTKSNGQTPELLLLQRFLLCAEGKVRTRAWAGTPVNSLWSPGRSSVQRGSILVSWQRFSQTRNHLRAQICLCWHWLPDGCWIFTCIVIVLSRSNSLLCRALWNK